MRRGSSPVLAFLMLSILASAAPAEMAETSCVICHADPDMFDEPATLAIVADVARDVHAEAGLSCHDCHGGNPDPALADDASAAMDPDFAANRYEDPPDRAQIPGFCGRCHSDPGYMKRFRPDARVDQEQEYWTSGHGISLKKGDTNVATCIDCHSTHGILRAGDSRSPVYPRHIAETCNTCHGDPKLMEPYTLADGRPLPTDQYNRWRRSVHAKALIEKEDLSAPTCNDCHGNHGAAPPGLESVAFVCGQCHGREAELFRGSAKHAGFEEHNEQHLPDMGTDGCADCHDAPEPAAQISTLRSFFECSVCHQNHGIVRPTVAQLAPVSETPCAMCHESTGTAGRDLREPEQQRRNYEERRDALLNEARSEGLSGDALYDWLVDAALELPTHTIEGTADADGQPTLRPEFSRLFDKFRIGKTYFTYFDPSQGEEVRQSLSRCTDCHGDEESDALIVARDLVARQQELMVLTAQAERTLLAARRGGVEVGEAHLALDRAVDAQIELQVLVHSFAAGDGAFGEKHADGIEHAGTALAIGQAAIAELGFRRSGLAISLVFVVLVLIGLALKIRETTEREA